MKTVRLIQTSVFFTVFLFFTTLFCGSTLQGQEKGSGSLLEYYNTADKETLSKETNEMTENLKSVFSSKEIKATEAELEFSSYITNFKNLIRYMSKLTGYADYEKNIKFGRDREIYQVLPEEGKLEENRKLVIDEKYDRLETITKEEILTYQDTIESSFDACEIYTNTLFWGDKLFQNPKFKETMDDYFRDEMFQTYKKEERPILEKSHPEYVNRIDRLVSLWKEPPLKPHSPIIDPDIVEKL